MTKRTKAYLALLFICIVWGTTYLAIRIGVMHYPAFLFAGVRQTIAGVLLMLAAFWFNKNKDFSRKNILRQMLVGFLMLTVGNGGVTWGEKYIPSGISALICSMMPIFAVLLNLLSSKKDRFNLLIGSGLLLGTFGVALIFRHNLEEVTINKKDSTPVNPFLNSGMQLLFGGIFMLLLSPVIDDYTGLQLWNTDGIISLVYLIIFGSVFAYAAYMYALSELPVGLATIYAYINPLIAVIAGYLFLSEELNIYIVLAFITIVVSVYLVNMGYRKQHKADEKLRSKQAEAFPESAPTEL